MKKYFRFLCYIARIIPVGLFSNVTFWRHRDGNWLYICLSEEHINDEKKFVELFEKAIRISIFEFDLIHYFYPEIEIVTVADDKIHSQLQEDEGAYANDDHEESEDKYLTKDSHDTNPQQ